MSKREKIILVLMALTVVYGFYALFLENPTPRGLGLAESGSKLEAFNKFITNVAALTKDGLSEIDSYIIEHIPSKWTKDPLLNTKKDFEFEAGDNMTSTSAKQLGIIYSGFLQMGDRSLAIINGLEYEAGEKLQDGGHTVGEIFPNRVVIVMRGGKQQVTVPLEETQ